MTCCFDLHHYCQISQYQNHRLKYAIHPNHIRVSPSFYMFLPKSIVAIIPIPTATSQKFSHLLSFFYPYPLYQSCIQTNNESHHHVPIVVQNSPKKNSSPWLFPRNSTNSSWRLLDFQDLKGPENCHWYFSLVQGNDRVSKYFLPLDKKKTHEQWRFYTPKSRL